MKHTLITIAAVALALISCNKQETAQVVMQGTPVRFTASMAQQYQVKSTTVDNPFEEGTRIGIFAGAPILSNNYEYAVTSMPTAEPAAAGALAVVDEENPILWKQGQSSSTTFYAYSPYASAHTDASAMSVAVQANQSTLANVNSSDFMAATALNVTPGAAAELSFNHKFHKIIILVENKLAQPVSKVQIKNVRLGGTVNLAEGTFTPSEEASGIIDAFDTESTTVRVIETVNHTYDVYTAIIFPQTAQPQIVVTTGTNTTYTFSLASALAFASNQTATAILTLESAAASADAVSFSFTLGAWGENTDMEYGNGVKEVADPFCWSIIGHVGGTDWNHDFYMTQNSTNEYEYYVTNFVIAPGDSFKFRRGSAWADAEHTPAMGYLQYGLPQYTESVTIPETGMDVDLSSGTNGDIVINVSEPTEFDMYLKTNLNQVWIKKSE